MRNAKSTSVTFADYLSLPDKLRQAAAPGRHGGVPGVEISTSIQTRHDLTLQPVPGLFLWASIFLQHDATGSDWSGPRDPARERSRMEFAVKVTYETAPGDRMSINIHSHTAFEVMDLEALARLPGLSVDDSVDRTLAQADWDAVKTRALCARPETATFEEALKAVLNPMEEIRAAMAAGTYDPARYRIVSNDGTVFDGAGRLRAAQLDFELTKDLAWLQETFGADRLQDLVDAKVFYWAAEKDHEKLTRWVAEPGAARFGYRVGLDLDQDTFSTMVDRYGDGLPFWAPSALEESKAFSLDYLRELAAARGVAPRPAATSQEIS